jgi:hypothetical protein
VILSYLVAGLIATLLYAIALKILHSNYQLNVFSSVTCLVLYVVFATTTGDKPAALLDGRLGDMLGRLQAGHFFLLVIPIAAAALVPNADGKSLDKALILLNSSLLILFLATILESEIFYAGQPSIAKLERSTNSVSLSFSGQEAAVRYLRGEYFTPESSGTWTGRQIEILIPLQKPFIARYRLALDYVASAASQKTVVTINGYPRATYSGRWAKPEPLIIYPSEMLDDGVLRIGLVNDELSEISNLDRRRLGFFYDL